MQPLSSVSGIISGIQSQQLVDQIIQLERRPADRLRSEAAGIDARLKAIATYQGLLEQLRDASRTLRDGSAFDGLGVTASAVAGTRAIASATTTNFALPGQYRLAVTSLAQQQKVGSAPVLGNTVAAGAAGTISLNGKASVTILATDSLNDIRDKINAANTGAAGSGVAASVLGTGSGNYRLVLTSTAPGSAGLILSDTTGNALQTLGINSNATTIAPAAVLVPGSDAVFSVDGIAFTRTSNTISDAIDGVTLTLTGAEPGAITQLEVSRSPDTAKAAMQGFVDAYNAVVDFIQQQNAPSAKGPLANDSLLRQPRASLPSTLLAGVAGAPADFATAARAGLSLDRAGKLSLDADRFTSAFADRLADLRTLFQQHATTTDPATFYVSSGTATAAGTYAIAITQAATQASVTGAGLGDSYTDDGTGDTMTVTDTALNRSVNITLTSGMTSAQIVAALNSAFASGGLGIFAAGVGGEVKLTQAAFGATAGITVAYTAGGTLGNVPVAAGSYANGLDVQGTIGGSAAAGSGQVLVGGSGAATAGLVIRYTGAAAGPAGDVTVAFGTGALIERLLTGYTESSTGTIATRQASLTDRSARLIDRADVIDARLELRRTQLLKSFAATETALSRLQSQSQSLTASLGALLTAGGGN